MRLFPLRNGCPWSTRERKMGWCNNFWCNSTPFKILRCSPMTGSPGLEHCSPPSCHFHSLLSPPCPATSPELQKRSLERGRCSKTHTNDGLVLQRSRPKLWSSQRHATHAQPATPPLLHTRVTAKASPCSTNCQTGKTTLFAPWQDYSTNLRMKQQTLT